LSPDTHGHPLLDIEEEGEVERWECLVCGYIYDPAEGDPQGGIPSGTPFEELPDDWVCPECGAAKEMFERLEE